MLGKLFAVIALITLAPVQVLAAKSTQSLQGGAAGNPLTMILLLAALSLLPFVLIVTTSFIKFSVVFSILRNALGTPQLPPTIVVTALSVLLTTYVMAPTGMAAYDALGGAAAFSRANSGRSGPSHGLLSGESAMALFGAASKVREPLRVFMHKHSHASDRSLFRSLAQQMWPKALSARLSERHFLILTPAFVIGQLSAAFRIGFLLFVPFIVIDMVIANILLALGMHMLSPTTVSLPFKLLLFVMVDGWQLLTRGLVLSYH